MSTVCYLQFNDRTQHAVKNRLLKQQDEGYLFRTSTYYQAIEKICQDDKWQLVFMSSQIHGAIE